MPRPKQTIAVPKGPIPDCAETLFINENKPEIGGDAGLELQGLADADIVSAPFEALEIIQLKPAQETDHCNHREGD